MLLASLLCELRTYDAWTEADLEQLADWGCKFPTLRLHFVVCGLWSVRSVQSSRLGDGQTVGEPTGGHCSTCGHGHEAEVFFFSSEIPILFDSSLGHCELIPMFHVMSEKEGTSREVR